MSVEELVDIYDEKQNKTGQVLPKSEAHKQSLRHSGAHLWIYNSKGEILFQLRSPQKEIRPNIWDVSVAGHIEAGDSAPRTLIRESREELSLDIDPAELKFVGIKTVDDSMNGWQHKVYNWTYVAKKDVDVSKLKLQKNEVSDVRWVPVDEFEKEINDPEKSKKYTPQIQELYAEIIAEVKKSLSKL